MGQGSAATVKEIEDIRSRLDTNMRELERRMPQPAVWAKRVAGLAVGGGTAALVTVAILKRVRGRRKRTAAERLKGHPAQAVVQVVPAPVADRLAEAIEEGRWKQWAAVAGGVWLAVRLIELRQLRRVNRALVGARA
jgi:transposase